MAARCETVLNTTMAEMETYHTQKGEDFRVLITEHLDGEIAFYEQVYTNHYFLKNVMSLILMIITDFASTQNIASSI